MFFLKFLFVLFDLALKSLKKIVSGRFERTRTLFGKKVLSRDKNLSLSGLIVLFSGLLITEEYFNADDVLIEAFELSKLIMNEVFKLLVSIEMNGMDRYLHSKYFVRTKHSYQEFSPLGWALLWIAFKRSIELCVYICVAERSA